jgi:hypothetical protein
VSFKSLIGIIVDILTTSLWDNYTTASAVIQPIISPLFHAFALYLPQNIAILSM